MGLPWSQGRLETATYQLQGGGVVAVEYRRGAGLGFVPWPGSFALAAFLDTRAEALGLREKSALELGSGACSVSGLVAGHLCKKVVLSDRPEVVHDLYVLIQRAGLSRTVSVKVLDWNDLEFIQHEQQPGAADLILMTDVVYFPTLWKPLLHTLLLLSSDSTVIYWANCDRYPHFVPDLDRFLVLLEAFFTIAIEEERLQSECEGPGGVPGGHVVIRSLRLLDAERAQEEVEHAIARNCARRCIP